jgi:hypothetical protein
MLSVIFYFLIGWFLSDVHEFLVNKGCDSDWAVLFCITVSIVVFLAVGVI